MTCLNQKFGHNFVAGYCTRCQVSQQDLSYPLKEKKIKLPEPEYQGKKIDYEYQLVGLDMMKWFKGEREKWIWSLFYQYPLEQIKDGFTACKKQGNRKLKYLVGILKKL